MTTAAAGQQPASPLRVLVCGTNFGRFYAEAVRSRPGYVLTGLMARGSEASRAYARTLSVPLYTDVEELPEDGIDLACVVVGSAISGGAGTELALRLMDRGLHVLQEHPMHLDELTACIRAARCNGVQYRVNTHYPHVEPVRDFISAARQLGALQTPLFVDAATPIHLLHPLVDIIGRALGALRPWQFADPAPLSPNAGPQPFRVLQGVLAGVPLTLRVHHQMDPADRDNHALHWHRVAVGTEGGVLTLADTHGPLLWSPRLHAERDAGHRFLLDGPSSGSYDLETTSVVRTTGRFRDVFDRLWPEAVGHALDGIRDALAGARGTMGGSATQYDLTVCRIWSDLAKRLGPPEVVRQHRPRPLSVAEVFPGRDNQPAVTARDDVSASYTPSAEFFDLVATGHTATSSAPAVAEALAGLDTTAGEVVDIGAGTGLVTEAVARALPLATIVASEPAVGMRAVLTSRAFSDPDLRRRVTVTDGAAPDLDLPDRICAALLCGVLGHLDAAQRRVLWDRLLARLAPGGRILVELMQPAVADGLPETRLVTATAGTHRYEWWLSSAPEDSAVRLDTTWRIYPEEAAPGTSEPLREVHDTYRWAPLDLDAVAAESGLHARLLPTRPGAPPLAVLTQLPMTSPVPHARTEESR